MKFLLRAAPLLLLACLPGAAYADAPTTCNFAVTMPGPVKKRLGDYGGRTYTALRHGTAYWATCGTLAFTTEVTPANVQQVLERHCQPAEGSTLLSRRKLTVQGHPACEVEYRSDDGQFTRDRFIIVGSWLYRVTFITRAAKPDAAEIEAYVSSFHPTDQ